MNPQSAPPSPLVTVDVVLLTLIEQQLHVALCKRERDPFTGAWALPGGYVHVQDDADVISAAERILREKTKIDAPYLEQLATFAGSHRDPRGWSLSVVYFAVVSSSLIEAQQQDSLKWVPVSTIRSLPFDHAAIVQTAISRIQSKTGYSSVFMHMMPEKFTLSALQETYEALMGGAVDKRSFRRWVDSLDALKPVGSGDTPLASHRPAQYYALKPAFKTQLAVTAKSLDLK